MSKENNFKMEIEEGEEYCYQQYNIQGLQPYQHQQQTQTNQFSQEQQNRYQLNPFEQQLKDLNDLGFTKRGKNIGLIKKFHGNMQEVVAQLLKRQERKCQKGEGREKQQQFKEEEQQETLEQLLKKTTTLIIDCNNVVYADDKQMRKNNYKLIPQKFFKKLFKEVLMWGQAEESGLVKVQLIWDIFNFDKFISRMVNKSKWLQKVENNADRVFKKPHKRLFFDCFTQMRNQVLDQLTGTKTSIDKITLVISLSKSLVKQNVSIEIVSASPQYRIADDMIVDEVKKLNDESKMQTTVVTSDRELRLRLQQEGLLTFVGNGRFHFLQKNLRLRFRNSYISTLKPQSQ